MIWITQTDSFLVKNLDILKNDYNPKDLRSFRSTFLIRSSNVNVSDTFSRILILSLFFSQLSQKEQQIFLLQMTETLKKKAKKCTKLT